MKKGKRRPRRRFRWKRLLGLTALLSAILLALYVVHLDREVRLRFEGKRWAIPAHVYARPLELYAGLALTPEQLLRELDLAGYRQDSRLAAAGSYDREGATVQLVSRSFDFGDSREPSRRLTVRFADGRVAAVETGAEQPVALARLDPAQIGSFYPLQREDRVLVKREEIPTALIHALLAVEDRDFYNHHGIDPRAILRALWADLRAGATVQGGSTLTQQLVKNMFLTDERTLWRKLNEAIMAVLLEAHYDKDEILTAYVNEVFLGQDGQRAIHGFGLASQFYFRRRLQDLDLSQLVLLVGLVKGPSYYDPRRFPDRGRRRRDLVLTAMTTCGFITPAEAARARVEPLDQNLHATGGITSFPAFIDLVRRRLQASYREEDLTSEGLKIFTTFDPQVQWQLEEALRQTLPRLERQSGCRQIQAAVVVSSPSSGEIEAIVGGRTPEAGFNRALDARRPVGSLVKPAVYLAALENGFTLASLVKDTRIEVANGHGGMWRPRNFERLEHGEVELHTALAHSYNLATVNLGLAVGLDKVKAALQRLGIERISHLYPSVLLGALPLSPLEVSQMYQTLAAGGFYSPQRVIRKVLDASNRPLERYPLTVEQRVPPQTAFLVDTVLREVVSEGTGRSLARYLPPSLAAAGKTGTSDDLRDSWFAGFTGDRLAVVWLGRDDDRPLGLTGAGGALVVWGELMRRVGGRSLELNAPPGIEWAWIDPQSGTRVWPGAPNGEYLPFADGTAPAASAQSGKRGRNWLGRLLNKIF
ncbi:MAG: penicillin-binding protein 1B [Deltaproteobacteria bacterium]